MLTSKVTLFESIRVPGKPYTSAIKAVLDRIRTGHWRAQVDTIRAATLSAGHDSNPVRLSKRNLPVIAWAGEFEYRSNHGLLKHSGVIAIDLDKVSDDAAIKAQLRASPNVAACWKSCTDTGMWVLVPVTPLPTNNREHGIAFERAVSAIEYSTGLALRNSVLDGGARDVARACFVSYDPEIYVNDAADPVVWNGLDSVAEVGQLRALSIGSKPSLGELQRLLSFIPRGPKYPDWIKIIGAVGDCVGSSITKEEAIWLLQEWSPEQKEGEYCNKLEHGLSRIGVETLIGLARQAGWSGRYEVYGNGELVELALQKLAQHRANSTISPNSTPLQNREQFQPAVYPEDSIIEQWMELGRAQTESADAYLDGAIHPIIAALLGRRVWFPWGCEKRYPNAFTIIVGPPGDRKSSAIKLLEALARSALPSNAFLPGSFSPEALFDEYDENSGGRPDKLLVQDDANPMLVDWRNSSNGERVSSRFLTLYDCCPLSENFRRNKKEAPAKEGRRSRRKKRRPWRR